MNLWMVLAITGISISSVIADSKWFVKDKPLDGAEEELFSSEHLIPVPTPKHKPKTGSHEKPTSKTETTDRLKVKANTKERTPNIKPNITMKVKEHEKEDDMRAEHLIPVSGRKLLQAVENNVQKSRKTNEMTKTKTTGGIPTSSSAILSTDDARPLCNPEKDVECLMENEDLVLVPKTKATHTSSHKSVLKPINRPVSTKQDLRVPVKKEIPRKLKEKNNVEVPKSSLHRRLLQDKKMGRADLLNVKPILQPLLVVVEEDGPEDDLLATEGDNGKDNTEDNVEEIINRFKRELTAEDEGSGDGSFVEKQPPTDDPEHIIPFSITIDKTFPSGKLSAKEKANYTQEVQNKLYTIFGSCPAFKVFHVTDIKLDKDNRVVVDWDVMVKTSDSPGNTTDMKLNNTLDCLEDEAVPSVKNMTVLGDPLKKFKMLDGGEVKYKARILLTDVCKASNACPDGYDCVNLNGRFCHHKCYSSNLIDSCQNGGSCQISPTHDPYCQCGKNYEGDLCQTAKSSDNQYTVGQKIGAGVGAAVVLAAASSVVIYLLCFRRKKEEEMDYSYFGDNNSEPNAFQDVDSNLGIVNCHINRPRVSLVPLDIYHQTTDHT